MIARICRDGAASRRRSARGRAGDRIRAGWEDLVLPADRLLMLREFLLWIEHQQTTVGRRMGRRERRRAGGAVRRSFGHGQDLCRGGCWPAPWTGRCTGSTSAGWSASTSGETEENLNRLFDAAHGQPMVLQFDEADSLFSQARRDQGGPRPLRQHGGEPPAGPHRDPPRAGDPHHQPAPATWTRPSPGRFQVVVDFPRPDADARARTVAAACCRRGRRAPPRWTSPVLLGAVGQLTGGQIRNAALHAAYLGGRRRPAHRPGAHSLCRHGASWARTAANCAVAELGPLADHLPRECLHG
ncbi:MAG: hypothetical protein MZW92_65605 [Comamonadaceae bacterium]|nr:hypothetical protein [Comamonadaceae bacterium]